MTAIDTPAKVGQMAHAAGGPDQRRRFDDRGDIILGWFTRVAVFLLLLGIISFEGISLIRARFAGDDQAAQVAMAAADAYAPRRNVRAAYAAAAQEAADLNVQLDQDKFLISADGSVDVTISKTATTLFLYRTPQTAKWAVVRSSAHATGTNR